MLCGCTVGPDFVPPRDGVRPQWWGPSPGSTITYGGDVDPSWWDNFHDPELSRLIGRLARQNLDLLAAAERVEQERAQTRIASAQGLPDLDANGNYERVRLPPAVLSTFVTPKPTAPEAFDLFQDNLSAAWEIDLFGRVRREVEARQATIDEAVDNRHSLALMAISDLAQDYMQLRTAQSMAAITRASIANADENIRLVGDQFGNGVGNTLDIANARAQRDSIAATLPPLLASQARLINAIGLLLAQPPRALQPELGLPTRLPAVPPTVPVGFPSELARRRPDVLAAEARLHAATAETAVAVADFYPSVRLTGQLGTQSLRFPQIFNLVSGAYMVGPSIDLPIFEGGRLRATLRLRRSEQREAALQYQQTVLQAWSDVDDALDDYTQARHRRDDIAAQVAENEIALNAARQRYRQGVVDYLNVTAAESALFAARNSLADSDAQIATDLVQIYRALGGGWQIAR